MLEPSLPWLAVGYSNLKQEDFCQRQTRDEITKYRIDTTDPSTALRWSTRQGQQRRRVKSATLSRFIACRHDNLRTPARPKSAKSCSHRAPPVGQTAEKLPFALRRGRPHSAVFLRHQVSPGHNQSDNSAEHKHYIENTNQLFVDGRDSRCAFCPVESRPKSSINTHRPPSSTGLVSAYSVPTHYDRYVSWTRPRTAPATRREFQQLPQHNNIHRGNIPHYTSFVKRIELRPRVGTPASPPSRRRVHEDYPAKHQSPSMESSSNPDEEDRDTFLSEDENFDDELSVAASLCVAAPSEHIDDESLYEEVGSRTGDMPKAPTPSPAVSGRASPEPEFQTFPVGTELTNETEELESQTPNEPTPPRELSPPAGEPTPPPREPTPPPREPTPPPQEPTPPPRESTPPPQEPTPPPREPTPPPREPTPPPREPTPPPQEPTPLPQNPTPSPNSKPKKQVKIKETPVQPTNNPKSLPDGRTKSCLVKKPETPTQQEPKMGPPSESSVTQEGVLEDDAVGHEKERSEQNRISRDAVANYGEQLPEKQKLGPPPKFKVNLFSLDPQELLDTEMKMRRKEIGDCPASSVDSMAPPIIPEHLLRKKHPWPQGRLALSRRACRFELPMDVRRLENMTPTEYLQKHCIVNTRRQAMYRRAFNRADKDNDMKLNVKEFYSAVIEALVDTVDSQQIQDVLRLIEAEEMNRFTPKLFCAICSLLERLHYRDFVTEDTVHQESFVDREIVEEVDFLALDWKFEGCCINPTLKHLLYML